MRLLEFLITENEAGRTVKSIARQEMNLSSTQFKSLKFKGAIQVDGRIARADERLQPGQRLMIFFHDEGAPVMPYDLPLSIPYQDEDFLIVDKPAPLPSISSVHQQGATLENALFSYLGCPENFVFRPVNRLDKGTSGLMAVARNAHAQQLLQKQLHTDHFIREYLAVCEGEMEAEAGVIDLPILDPVNGIKRIISPEGRPARTHFQVLHKINGRSLLRLRLETGRTHQIRVHLSHLGCPITGDFLYGREHPVLPGRFALHSCLIRFVHPVTKCEVIVNSGLPPEMEALLN
ncbi:MAG: RluA family pseudouridine synthase [Clostridia bacterium]|nr:RluA family pseudouridine synthase [Clostridia bacterium]